MFMRWTLAAIVTIIQCSCIEAFFLSDVKHSSSIASVVESSSKDSNFPNHHHHVLYPTTKYKCHPEQDVNYFDNKEEEEEEIQQHSIMNTPAPRLTILLPAFNEELRIGKTIQRYLHYLQTSSSVQWNTSNKNVDLCDILVIDDGSTDDTCRVVQEIGSTMTQTPSSSSSSSQNENPNIFIDCISLEKNEGKGAAVARGMEEIHAKYLDQKGKENSGWVVLVADADGSGDIRDLDKMMYTLEQSILNSKLNHKNRREVIPDDNTKKMHDDLWHQSAIVVGNRGYEGTSSIVRTITRWGFRTTVKLFCGELGVNDTQCGFKLMTISAGYELYSDLTLKRWTHDVEVLYRAKEMGIPVDETKIGWVDMEGSKLTSSFGGTVVVSIVMLLEVMKMRFDYFCRNIFQH